MKMLASVTLVFAVAIAALGAQETKPLKKDEVRVSIPGCTKGYIFTASERTEEHPGSAEIPPGAHLRMNGPKKMISDIKAHEGSLIEITGTMKKGQFDPSGVSLGGGVRVGQPPESRGGMPGLPGTNQVMIDLESWRPITGECPAQ
jgi:hypothetical protein